MTKDVFARCPRCGSEHFIVAKREVDEKLYVKYIFGSDRLEVKKYEYPTTEVTYWLYCGHCEDWGYECYSLEDVKRVLNGLIEENQL